MRFFTSLIGRFILSGLALILGLALICLFAMVVAPVIFMVTVGWKMAVAALL